MSDFLETIIFALVWYLLLKEIYKQYVWQFFKEKLEKDAFAKFLKKYDDKKITEEKE